MVYGYHAHESRMPAARARLTSCMHDMASSTDRRYWVKYRYRAARARSKFIDLPVPVLDTTCHIMHAASKPRASRGHVRLMCMVYVYHAYDLNMILL